MYRGFAGGLRRGGVLRPTGERVAQGVDHAVEVVVVAGQRVRVLGIGRDALGELGEDDVVLDVVVGPQLVAVAAEPAPQGGGALGIGHASGADAAHQLRVGDPHRLMDRQVAGQVSARRRQLELVREVGQDQRRERPVDVVSLSARVGISVCVMQQTVTATACKPLDAGLAASKLSDQALVSVSRRESSWPSASSSRTRGMTSVP